jgi:uncharacterized sodium:solute symporter family permease YidK
VASKYFVPFYRSTGEISAYTHLEKRFGTWARTYAVICFLLTQFARMGTIFFGIALSLQALTGFSMASIMIVMGICIIIYTVLGGMEAVISNVKRGFNLFRCDWKGREHFDAKVLWSVIAYNIRVMTGLMLEKLMPQPQ